MIKVYIMLALVLVGIIIMVISSLKRNKVMSEAEKAGGVSFRHRNPDYLRSVVLSFVWILITGGNILLELSKRDVTYEVYDSTRVMFYAIAMASFAFGTIYWLGEYMKYDEFRLCDNCFYLSGHKYDCKKYRYTLEDNAVIFSAKHMVEMRITVPEDKRKEVLGILEQYYTKVV